MKSEGKYRFTLQWMSDSNERVRAGELLERLGNSKSKFIVAAVNEYVQTHPEFASATVKVKLVVKESSVSYERIEQIVRRIVDEKIFSKSQAVATPLNASSLDNATVDILNMIENLELF